MLASPACLSSLFVLNVSLVGALCRKFSCFVLNTTIVPGNRELLEVEVDGNPKPFVEWYLDGKLVADSRTLRTYFDGRVAFLKIYGAHEERQGQYLCRASNKLGAVETRCTVIVQRKHSTIERF